MLPWQRFRGNDFFGPVVAKRVAEKNERDAGTKGLKENATSNRQGPDTVGQPRAEAYSLCLSIHVRGVSRESGEINKHIKPP